MSERFVARPVQGTVRILSDLHLGHDQSVIRRAESLRPLLAGADEVIFNGDTLQERAERYRPRSLELLAGLQAVCGEEGVLPVFLRGNHDPTAWTMEMVDLLEGRITVTHGDVWLRLISPWSRSMPEYRPRLEAIHREYPSLSRLSLGQRFDLLQRCRLALPATEASLPDRPPGNPVSRFFREIWPPRRPWEILKVYARLPALASAFVSEFRPRSRVLVFGHTHRARVWRRGGRLLVNTGAFVHFAQPLMVEIRGREVSVWRLAEVRGQWQKQQLAATRFLDPVADSASSSGHPGATDAASVP